MVVDYSPIPRREGASDLERRMRAGEWWHSLTVPKGMWTIVRVDGRSFTRLVETRGYERPFDERFASAMQATAARLLTEFGGVYAYTESDEISILLPRGWDMFDRELEKIVSLTAATATAAFIHATAPADYPTFDSRVWMAATDEDVLDYFRWRQDDAFRCCLNGWAYWTLRGRGASAARATGTLEGTSTSEKNEMLHDLGVNINDVPAWQRRGVGLWWEEHVKVGHNPITGEDVEATRRRVRHRADLPRGDGYRHLLGLLLPGRPLSGAVGDWAAGYPDGVPDLVSEVVLGNAQVEDEDDWVERWHLGGGFGVSLDQWLGLTEDQGELWAKDPAGVIERAVERCRAALEPPLPLGGAEPVG
jgi:tRNA(His) 5'-end guanylyltransferase